VETEETQSPDQAGRIQWLNLPGATISLSVLAQGYLPLEQTVNIERGPNDLTLTLEHQPYALHPLKVCQPGQELLYLEDFEDGQAQGWEPISRPMWNFEEIEDRGTVLTYSEENTEAIRLSYESGEAFGDFVWSLDMINGGDVWLFTHIQGDMKYLMRFNPPGEGLQIIHVEGDQHKGSVYRGLRWLPYGVWQHVAIAFFEGSLEFWIDGELILALDDPNPLGPGAIQVLVNSPGEVSSFDNLVICGLTEPYSPPPPEDGE
jgi:hypothetical protein